MSDIPPWAPAVQRLPDGRWQPLLLAADPVPTEEQARELAEYLVRQLDARLRDVGRQLDAATPADAAPPVPAVVFTGPDPLRPTEGEAR
jgi:hypothetical protein